MCWEVTSLTVLLTCLASAAWPRLGGMLYVGGWCDLAWLLEVEVVEGLEVFELLKPDAVEAIGSVRCQDKKGTHVRHGEVEIIGCALSQASQSRACSSLRSEFRGQLEGQAAVA